MSLNIQKNIHLWGLIRKRMGKNLVIVESPAKAKTIAGYLGKDFEVKSSYGHIRDLPKDDLSIDVENNFEKAILETFQKMIFP